MEHFAGVTMDIIGSRYRNNQLLLVQHLMDSDLLSSSPPICHGNMALYPGDPWRWRCTRRDCGKNCSVVTPGCFVHGHLRFYNVFKAAYLWSNDHPSKVIQKEAELDKKTVASLLSEWRALLPQQTGYCSRRGLGSDASLRLDRG